MLFPFYLFVTISAISGFYMKWGDVNYKEIMETIHKLAIYRFPIFIIFHFGGILIAELKNKKGIASKMISGE